MEQKSRAETEEAGIRDTNRTDIVLCHTINENDKEKEKKAEWRNWYLDALRNDFNLICKEADSTDNSDYGSINNEEESKEVKT